MRRLFFSTIKPLSQEAIATLFEELRDSVDNPGPNLIEQIRGTSAGITYSVICFAYDRLPAFFDKSLVPRDRVHGFMLLVEAPGYLAIVKSRFEIPTAFRSEWLDRVESRRVGAAVATADAIFQRLRIKPMTISRTSIRAKTLEANDLANAMPMAGASRSIPQGYTVRRGSNTYSTTPSTGHISMRTDKANYEMAVSWARIVIENIDSTSPDLASFIENFARPVQLSSLKTTFNATILAIDVAELSDRLFEDDPEIKLVRKLAPDSFKDLSVEEMEKIIESLDKDFLLSGSNTDLRLKDHNNIEIGTLRWGKARITLSTFAPRELKNVYVASNSRTAANNSQIVSLKTYIDREDMFLILFDDVSFAYVNGELFQDKEIVDGGNVFLSHLIPATCLNDVKSEKGTFKSGNTQFSRDSVFRKVVDTLAADHDVLICDDLGDEWADFIGLDTVGKPPRISFFTPNMVLCRWVLHHFI